MGEMGEELVAVGFRCFHCNASLPLRASGIVTCPRCGGENHVKLPGPPPSKAGLILALALGLVATSSAAFVMGYLLLTEGPGRHPSSSAPVTADAQPTDDQGSATRGKGRFFPSLTGASDASSIVSWVGASTAGVVLLDVDADGDPDLIGFGVASGGGVQMMAVSTSSGRVLWRNADLSDSSLTVFTDNKWALLLGSDKDFSLSQVDAATGRKLWTVKLPDKPEGASFGEGCAVVKAANGALVTLSLPAGTAAPSCPGAPTPQARWSRKEGPLTIGSTELSFSATSPGTPRLIVRATKGQAKLWEQTLPITADSFIHTASDVPHAVSPLGLLVAGQRPGEPVVTVQLIDPETGAIKASHDIRQKETHGSTFIRLGASSRAVVLQTFGKAYSLALPSLEPRWEAGAMW